MQKNLLASGTRTRKPLPPFFLQKHTQIYTPFIPSLILLLHSCVSNIPLYYHASTHLPAIPLSLFLIFLAIKIVPFLGVHTNKHMHAHNSLSFL